MRKNGKITLAVLAAAIVLATAVRMFVISSHTDMTTGFIYHGDEMLCNLLYYGVIAAAATASIFTLRIGQAGMTVGRAEDIPGGGVVVLGFLDLAAGIFAVLEAVNEYNAISPTVFLMVSDYVFAAIIIAIGFVTLFKRHFTPGLGFSYAIIGVYVISRALYGLMIRMSVIFVPEYLIEALAYIGMAIYFPILGRYLSGNEHRPTAGAMCFWGIGLSSMVLSSALGTVITNFTAPAEISERIVFTYAEAESFRQASRGIDAYNMVVTSWVDIVLALIVAVSVVLLLVSPSRFKEDE